MKTLLTTLNAKFVQSSLALRCLKTACAHAGINDVVTEEYTINHNAYDILRHIASHHADVIGFSCYIWNIEMTLHIASLIRQIMPQVIVFLGGPEVSYTARHILMERDDVDYILQGEGEEMVPAFLEALESHGAVTAIAGVLGREKGRIKGNESFVEVQDLDSLPFPYEEEDFSNLSHKIIYYESSRGCPFHCQYCLSGMNDAVRFRSVEKTLAELDQFVRAGVHQVKFVDRTFNCNPSHYRPLLQYMISLDQDVNFHLEIEPGVLQDEDLELLEQAPKGRIQLEMGIQSTYEPTLMAIHRHNDWPRITAIMNRLTKLGTIHLHLDLIVGLPYEDFEHLQKSFNDIYRLHPHKLQIGFLKLLKGSGIRREYDGDYAYDRQGPYEVLATTWLPYDRVQYMKVFEDVFERTYNSGKFTNFFHYLDGFYEDDSFALYSAMTDRWLTEELDQVALSDRKLCQFLGRFLDNLAISESEKSLGREILSLDMMVTFQFRLVPDFLGWKEAPRSVTDPIFRNDSFMESFIEGFSFTSWRDVKLRCRVWEISAPMAAFLTGSVTAAGPSWLVAARVANGVTWHVLSTERCRHLIEEEEKHGTV